MKTNVFVTQLLILLLLTAFITACGQESPPAPVVPTPTPQPAPHHPHLSGQIVFQSDRDGDWEIYSMNADGSQLVQLTDNDADDQYPVWSPDGSQIAFKSNRDGNYEIYVMQADGSQQRRVTNHPSNDEDPAWSPDGRFLAFHSDRESTLEVYWIAVDGSELTSFTHTIGKNGLPAWSPNGKRIAYTGNRYLGWNVYVKNVDQTGDVRITDGHGACRPDWSPDEAKLAYVSQQADGKGDVWLMNPDGSEKTQLTVDDHNYDYDPAWSPDGKYLIYTKMPDKQQSDWNLYVISADGQEEFQLTSHPAREHFADWK